ncbi:MAG: hypothetical protein K6C10_09390 [Prevotella sp.]|nr:hypothetical protein [Prevotella sp.]
MKQRIFSIFACLIMVGQTAWADEVKFTSRSWDETNKELIDTEVTVDASPIHSTDGWVGLTDGYYYVEGKVTLQTLKIMGTDVNLILCDHCELHCTGGVKLEGNTLLRIYGQSSDENRGLLNTFNDDYRGAAGIGCSKNCVDDAGNIMNSGSLEVYGGHIHTVGVDGGAGIGGGVNRGIGGHVSIYGGYLYIASCAGGAGIGGGNDGNQGGPVNIYGGIITAYSGGLGAGIGGGRHRVGGKVNIYGGFLDTSGATGIGTGDISTSDDLGLACDVLIEGGKVHSEGHYGAGIGGSFYPGGKVTINGGIVETQGQWGAGIGGGEDHSGTILITGGLVTAKDVYRYSAGIGGGDGGDCENVTITGGEIYAYGGMDAAGIGGGEGGNCKHLVITGGFVHATGDDYGAGIGAGEDGDVEYIEIGGTAKVYATGGERSNAVGTNSGNLGTIVLDDYYSASVGADGNVAEPTATANRVNAITTSHYARLEKCQHDIYYSVDTYEHTSLCHNCGYSLTEGHTYASDGTCVCGFKQNADVNVITVYRASGTGTAFAEPLHFGFLKNTPFTVPDAEASGLTFLGYVQDPATAPISAELSDGENEQQLNLITGTFTPTGNTTLYARYRTAYTEKWTWSDDYSSATLTLSGGDLAGPLTINATVVTPYVNEATAAADGVVVHMGIANYAHQTDGQTYTYQFTSTRRETLLWAISLANAEDNTATIEQFDNRALDVTLADRTLYKEGSWNTLCLPFHVYSLSGTPLEGATLKTLSSSVYADGTLTLHFDDATHIEAGKPYLLRWEESGSNIENPVFTNVTIAATSCDTVSTDYIDFLGTFAPVTLAANDRTKLFLSTGKKLYYPNADVTVNALRGYFELKEGLTAATPTAGANGVKAFVLDLGDDETTAISLVNEKANAASSKWYTLDGRALNGQPHLKGIYIKDGRKVVVK